MNEFFQKNGHSLVISPSILFWALGMVVGVWFILQVYEILLLFFLAIVLSASLEPLIAKVRSWKVSRGVAILVVYVGFFLVLGGLLTFLIPVLVEETQQVIDRLPETLEMWGLSQDIGVGISKELSAFVNIAEGGSILQGVFSTTVGIVKGVVGALAVVAMSLYILAVDGSVEKFIRAVTPSRYREYVVSRSLEAYHKSGRWLAGQIFLMGVVFLLYYGVLSVLGVPGALALAVWGGLLEIVPYIGPTLAAIPALILGFFVSPVTGILVLVSYILIQKLENYYLVPKVMERAVGLHPLVVILVLLVGGSVAGFMGLLLAVPLATVAGVFLRDAFERHAQ